MDLKKKKKKIGNTNNFLRYKVLTSIFCQFDNLTITIVEIQFCFPFSLKFCFAKTVKSF